MKVSKVGNIIILMLTSLFCVQSAPARPLNERSTEFAWVILDEQQNDSSLRRKITPKSIFIGPPIGYNCGTGYTQDANGRCIKVVKLNTLALDLYLLQNLNEELGNYDNYEDEEEENLPTAGPLQVNIPLNMDADRNTGTTFIAAPTNGHFDDTLKLEEPERSPVDAPFIITKISVEETAETTTAIPEDTLPTTTEVVTEEMSTLATVQETAGTETEAVPTTEAETETPQAIFFKINETTNPVVSSTEAAPGPMVPHPNSVRFPGRFDEVLFREFLNGENINRRFVVKQDSRHEEALYRNHRNRDRWLFPRIQSASIPTDKSR